MASNSVAGSLPPIPASARAGGAVSERVRLSTYQHVAVFDGWRGLAILSLLVGHFVDGFGVDPRFGMNCGRLGVELFFVLSGLLMGRILFVKRVPLTLFYKRRVSRIFPALIAYLTVVTLLLACVRHAQPGKAVLSMFFLSLNYYFGHSGGRVPDELQHLWSICIEEHGYLLLGFVAFLASRRRLEAYRWIALLVLSSWAFAVGYSFFTNWSYYEIFWRSEARLGGILGSACLAALIAARGRPFFGAPGVVVAFLLGVGLQTSHVPDVLKYTLGTLCLSFAVTHLEWAPAAMTKFFAHPLLVRLGVFSYSIYLWQQPFYAYYERHPEFRYPALAAAIAMGLLSYTLLEKPARAWLNARWEPGSPVSRSPLSRV